MLTKEKFAFVHKITKEDYASIAAKQKLEQAKTLTKKSEKILSTTLGLDQSAHSSSTRKVNKKRQNRPGRSRKERRVNERNSAAKRRKR